MLKKKIHSGVSSRGEFRLRAVPIFPLEFVEPWKDIANAGAWKPTIPAKSLWPPSEESPPPLPLFQCCYNDVDFSFDIFLNLQNNIGQVVWGKRKPLSNVIV